METKICKKCFLKKLPSFFSKNYNTCKSCIKNQKQNYDNTHKEEKKLYQKENADHIRKKNRKEILQNKKEYYLINKDRIQKYRENNKDKIKQSRDLYYINNLETIAFKSNKHKNAKYKNDLLFKLKKRLSAEILKALKCSGSSKNGHSILLYLEYSIQDLKTHLEKLFENWMSWENHGKYDKKTWDDNDSTSWKWQIDHIIPQSSLLYSSMEDDNFKKCWALENLRPLSAKQNIKDGNRRK